MARFSLRWMLGTCCLLAAAVAGAADGVRPIGLARVDITPQYPVRMTGYAGRANEFEGVEQRLWAKAMAIGSDEEGPAVIVTVDNLGVPGSMTDEVAARVAKKYPLVREKFVVCASHTHCGPQVAGVAPLITQGELPADQQAHIQQYTRDLADYLEKVTLAALAERKPGRLDWASGSVDFAVNRRRISGGKVSFGMTPGGPVDHALPMLRVTDPEGKLRGLLINYACHCTTLGGKFNRICGDWAGYAQEIIEREHPGVTAMISIGCGADANPQPRDELVYAQLHGQSIAREAKRLLAGPWTPINGQLTARLERIELPFDTLPSREEFAARAKEKGPIAYHAQVNLARLERGESLPTKLPYVIGTWCWGDELAMVFLAGEVVVDYDLRLKHELDGRRLWVTAYANDDPCYIASRRVLAEGGYEVDSSMYYYDRPTHFAPAVEDLIIGTVEKMVPSSYAAR